MGTLPISKVIAGKSEELNVFKNHCRNFWTRERFSKRISGGSTATKFSRNSAEFLAKKTLNIFLVKFIKKILMDFINKFYSDFWSSIWKIIFLKLISNSVVISENIPGGNIFLRIP